MVDTDDWKKRIAVDPAIQNGRPVIQGTRVPLYVLVAAVAAGDSIEEVCTSYRVDEADVRAALAFAAELLSKMRGRTLADAVSRG